MPPFPYDFYHFWAAARVALRGDDPYQVGVVYQEMIAAGWPTNEGFFGFLHPFWSLWLFAPLALLPFPIARVVWEFTLICTLAWSLTIILRSPLRNLLHIAAPREAMVYAAILFPPLVSTLYNGQSNAFVLLSVVAWLRLALSGKLFGAGVALSLTTLKPQLFSIFYAWLFLNEARRCNFKQLLGFICGWLVQCVIAVWIAPHSAENWWQAVNSYVSRVMILPTPSLSRILGEATGLSSIQYALTVLALITIVWLLTHNRVRTVHAGVSAMLPLSVLCAPYAWSHAFLPLLPTYLSMVSTFCVHARALTTYGVALFGFLGMIGMNNPHTLDIYMLVIPLALILHYRARLRQENLLASSSPTG